MRKEREGYLDKDFSMYMPSFSLIFQHKGVLTVWFYCRYEKCAIAHTKSPGQYETPVNHVYEVDMEETTPSPEKV